MLMQICLPQRHVLLAINLNDIVVKSLFWREQLNGEKVKREWLCYSPLSAKLHCFVCKLFAFDSKKSCWHQLVVASGSMHHATWPGTNLLTNTLAIFQHISFEEQKNKHLHLQRFGRAKNLTEKFGAKYWLEF